MDTDVDHALGCAFRAARCIDANTFTDHQVRLDRPWRRTITRLGQRRPKSKPFSKITSEEPRDAQSLKWCALSSSFLSIASMCG